MRVLILSQEHTESYCKQGLFGLAPVCSQAVSNSFSDLELKTTVEELKLLKLVAMDVNVVLFFPFFFFPETDKSFCCYLHTRLYPFKFVLIYTFFFPLNAHVLTYISALKPFSYCSTTITQLNRIIMLYGGEQERYNLEWAQAHSAG